MRRGALAARHRGRAYGGGPGAQKLRVGVVGLGALGSLFAAKLASAGCDVWALVRSEAQRDAIQRAGGLRLVDATRHQEETGATHKIEAFADAAQVKAQAREADVLVFLTKSYDTRATAHCIPLAELVRPDGGVVLTLQNGMGNREVLQASLRPAARTGSGPGTVPVVLQGITDVGALLTQPGEVRHTGTGNTFLPQHRLMHHMRDCLVQAGLEVAVTEDIDKRAWMKLMVNAAINPLTALFRIPNGQLLTNPHLLALAAEVVDEGVAVARASQVHLPTLFELRGDEAQAWEEARRRVFGYVQQVATATAHNRSSMLRDVERRRPTEIEFINGHIAREGRRLGVATGLNAHLCTLVQALSVAAESGAAGVRPD